MIGKNRASFLASRLQGKTSGIDFAGGISGTGIAGGKEFVSRHNSFTIYWYPKSMKNNTVFLDIDGKEARLVFSNDFKQIRIFVEQDDLLATIENTGDVDAYAPVVKRLVSDHYKALEIWAAAA